jgi:hypothetical protein
MRIPPVPAQRHSAGLRHALVLDVLLPAGTVRRSARLARHVIRDLADVRSWTLESFGRVDRDPWVWPLYWARVADAGRSRPVGVLLVGPDDHPLATDRRFRRVAAQLSPVVRLRGYGRLLARAAEYVETGRGNPTVDHEEEQCPQRR